MYGKYFTDILMVIEDPGAANFAAPLPDAFSKRGWHTTILTSGLAKDFFKSRNIRIEELDLSFTAEKILSTFKPRILIVGTSENKDAVSLKLISAARNSGVISVGIIDAAMNAPYRFRGQSNDPLTYAPDWLLVPDEWIKHDFICIGFQETHVIVCGHPHYDYVIDAAKIFMQNGRDRLKRRLFPQAKDGQKIVVFLAEGSVRLKRLAPPPVNEYTLKGRGESAGRTEIVLEEFLNFIMTMECKPYLILRLHPKDMPDDYKSYRDSFDYISSKDDPLELVFAADLVVGITSMLLMEAALMKRPTLSILPRSLEKDWLPSIRANVTPYVTERKSLASILPKFLCGEVNEECSDEIYSFANSSTEKIVNILESILTGELL